LPEQKTTIVRVIFETQAIHRKKYLPAEYRGNSGLYRIQTKFYDWKCNVC